jgi:hypothetical protein
MPRLSGGQLPVLLIGVGLGLLLSVLLTRAHEGIGAIVPLGEDEPWPPFVMVYRESYPFGEDIYRLTYLARRRWCTDRLSTDAPYVLPDGTRVPRPYVGGISCGERSVANGPERSVGFQTEWLVPAPTPPLARAPGAVITTLGEGLATITVVGENPPSLVPGKLMRQETTYRVVDGIPIRYIMSVDEKVTMRAEVLALRIGPDPTEGTGTPPALPPTVSPPGTP